MPATYEPIATTTLGSDAANISFNSITSSYTDLRIVLVSRTNRANQVDIVKLQFNSDTGTNYSNTYLRGDGTTASSGRDTSDTLINIYYTVGNNATASVFQLSEIDIFSYAGSTNKTVLATGASEDNQAGDDYVVRQVGLWRNTAAITSIQLAPKLGTNWKSGTTATLYGILKA